MALGEAGAHILVNGRNAASCKSSASRLRDNGISTDVCAFDITVETAATDAAGKLADDGIVVDILVNNAGIQLRKPLTELAPQEFRSVLDTNLFGAYLTSRAFAPAMIAAEQGKIINICSLQSELGRPNIGAYSAAKGGLQMLTRAMCAEWAGNNIQVNGIAPGYFITELTKPLSDDPEFDSWIKARTPAGRWGSVDELAGTVVYLAARSSSFVNGHILFVDGGLRSVV